MSEHVGLFRPTVRRRFLGGAVLAGAALLPAAAQARSSRAAVPALDCSESVQEVLSILITAEQVAITLYYTGLTTRAIVSHPYLAGSSADPNHVASNGNPLNVACFQAALDQERTHAALLAQQGGTPKYNQFYYPALTFQNLGYTRTVDTFLWVLDHVETALIGAYLAAVNRFALLGNGDLAVLCSRMLGPECQHRAIGRVVAQDRPANNVGLEVASFSCVSEVQHYLNPYLSGIGFAGGATPPIVLPSTAAMTAVIGKNKSS